MAVLWDGVMANGSPNRFAAKHLHVVDSSYTVERMKEEGLRILKERNSFVAVADKHAKYGAIKPKANTLVVTNLGGKQEMEAWVERNANASGEFEIPVKIGVIVQNWYENMASMNVFSEDAKVGGSFEASIEVSGATKRVYHMSGAAEDGIVLDDFKMNKGGVSFTA